MQSTNKISTSSVMNFRFYVYNDVYRSISNAMMSNRLGDVIVFEIKTICVSHIIECIKGEGI